MVQSASASGVASPTYWFMMQIGMIVGFFTAWPVNTWLTPRLEGEDVKSLACGADVLIAEASRSAERIGMPGTVAGRSKSTSHGKRSRCAGEREAYDRGRAAAGSRRR